MLRLVMPQALTILVDVIAWGLFHAGTGYAAHRLPDHRLRHDGWLLRPRPFETAGRWYRRWLQVDRWKDALPEAGDTFRGGRSLRHLTSTDDAGLRLFVSDTRRAELAHWWAMACGVVFLTFNPPLAAGLLVGYGVVINLPFIVIQRYNRFRTQSVLDRRRVRSASGPATPPSR